MRTTLTLENDLAQRVAYLARESHRSFQAVVNELLWRGLGGLNPGEAEFRVEPHAGHMQLGIDDRRLNELAWD
jgi:hypothetical protein